MARSIYRIPNFARYIVLLGSVLLTGCTSFDHDWKRAATLPFGADNLQGRWQGTWSSDVNHHNGELRCIVTRKDNGTYRARFHARYNRVLSFGYTVSLEVVPATNRFDFSGQANLNWYAGGIYHYAGHADATNFFSTYSCKYDHGTFRMERP